MSDGTREGLRAVIFDFDDTLADSSGVHELVWPQLVAVIERHVPGLDRAAFLERYDAAMERHYDRLLHGVVDFSGFRRERLAEALQPWAEVDDTLFGDYLQVKTRVVDELRPYPDAIATIRSLRATGIRVGVLTNGPSELQRRKLAVTGIAAEVDVIGISGEIGAHKPAGAAFAAVLELLDCGAAAAAMVGDSLANDVHGALAHGFAEVIWKALHPGEPPAGARRVDHLAEVLPLLGVPA